MRKGKINFIVAILFAIVMVGCFTIHPSATNPERTEITKCQSPDEGRLIVYWNQKDVDGYELNIAQNSDFTKNAKTFTYDRGRYRVSLGNVPTVTYFVRMRTFVNVDGEKAYSDWSDVVNIDIHSHNYTRTISVKPTCDKNGTYLYTCSCGDTYTFPIRKLGHNYQYVKTGTAEECGKSVCTRCGNVNEVVQHNFQLTKETEATCQNEGTKEYTCTYCGYVKTEKTSDKTDHHYEKTSETDKEIVYECTVCHKTYSEAKKVSNVKNEEKTEKTKDKTYTIDLGNGKTITVVGHYEREMASEIFNQLNAYRKEQGLATLSNGNDKLQAAADIRAYEIVNKFDHYRPNGERALISFKDTTGCCAENIARYQKSATEAMNGWKNSASHNKNMISKYPKSVSISVFAEKYTNKRGKTYYRYHYVQFFGW